MKHTYIKACVIEDEKLISVTFEGDDADNWVVDSSGDYIFNVMTGTMIVTDGVRSYADSKDPLPLYILKDKRFKTLSSLRQAYLKYLTVEERDELYENSDDFWNEKKPIESDVAELLEKYSIKEIEDELEKQRFPKVPHIFGHVSKGGHYNVNGEIVDVVYTVDYFCVNGGLMLYRDGVVHTHTKNKKELAKLMRITFGEGWEE